MKVSTQYKSPLVLNEIQILEANFRRSEKALDDLELGIHVDKSIDQISDEEYVIILDTTVSDDENKLFVDVKCRGLFKTEQENKGLVERNAIAIMFPYIRSYISMITTQPGMTPIVLPAMNIVAMLDAMDK